MKSKAFDTHWEDLGWYSLKDALELSTAVRRGVRRLPKGVYVKIEDLPKKVRLLDDYPSGQSPSTGSSPPNL